MRNIIALKSQGYVVTDAPCNMRPDSRVATCRGALACSFDDWTSAPGASDRPALRQVRLHSINQLHVACTSSLRVSDVCASHISLSRPVSDVCCRHRPKEDGEPTFVVKDKSQR